MNNKVIAHCCGGTGINIGEKVLPMVGELGDGFAEIVYSYIDTSTSNIDKITPLGDFWQVKTGTHSGARIDGSGSERKTNASDVTRSVNEYLDSLSLSGKVTGEYHMVISSASGGSGALISALIINSLMARNIPVFAVLVGDSSNSLYAKNTLKSLATLANIATAANKPLLCVYENNHARAGGGGLNSAEGVVNKRLVNNIATICLFLSNDNQELDNKDMSNLIDASQYLTNKIPGGLYGLCVHSKTVDVPEGAIPVIGRSLAVANTDYETGLALQHNKKGNITNQNVISIYKEQLPLHLVSYANYFTGETRVLNKLIEDYDNLLENIKLIPVDGGKNTTVDNGIVF